MIKFFLTKAYEKDLEEIEEFIFLSTEEIKYVKQFLDEHDRVLKFLEHNLHTPAVHPITGDQSWVFGEGRYRLFFKTVKYKEDYNIYLTHLIDNRRLNQEIYPSNTIPTYEEE